MNDKSIIDEENLLDEEKLKKPLYTMSDEEREHYVLYDKDGTANFYDRSDQSWKPIRAFVSKEDILKAKGNYPLPRIYPLRIIARFLFPFIIGGFSTLIIYFILSNINVYIPNGYYGLIFICVSFLDILFHLSDIIILIVQLYQKFAPDEVRERCHLHPSCSFYCIYAVMKYGSFIGIIKTLGRLHRCVGQDEIDEP